MINPRKPSYCLIHAAIKSKVKNAFPTIKGTDYQVDELWLDKTIDMLIYTLNTKKIAADEVEDNDIIDGFVEAIVERVCHFIEVK